MKPPFPSVSFQPYFSYGPLILHHLLEKAEYQDKNYMEDAPWSRTRIKTHRPRPAYKKIQSKKHLNKP